MNNWQEFLSWEQASRQTIDFKVIYVDATGDLIAGLLLSQIIYWNLPNKAGQSKFKAKLDGKPALAKERGKWWDECRITAKQYDRAVKILQNLGIVEVKNSLFNGVKMPFIVLNSKKLLSAVKPVLPKGENRFYPKVKTGIDQRVKPLTETTTETTTEITTEREEKKTSPACAGRPPLTELFNYWNSKANLPKIRTLSESRKAKLKKRFKEKEFADNWQKIIDLTAASAFCTGSNKRGWRADISWLIANDDNYVKVLEGNFDNNTKSKSDLKLDFDAEAAEQFRRKYG